MLRSHTCGELSKKNLGLNVNLWGWTHSLRDHGGLIFIDLRDNYGIIQCVINEEKQPKIVEQIKVLRNESVISVKGKVVARSDDTINKDLATGEIEIVADSLSIESLSEQIPFQVADETQNYPEDLRLKYRFLDLRTKRMHHNIRLRNDVVAFIRQEMWREGFQEFQTPILTASSPEGARDFLVPSRLHPGKFYALPQAPQQFKELLMVSGFDKYFQIAPCFRDEGARSDRVLEFYQLDVEMSFVEQDDVLNLTERVMHNVFRHFSSRKVTEPPFPRITYKDSLLRYGNDKPDLRNPIIIADVTEAFQNSDFSVFARAIENKAVVRAIPAPGTAEQPRSFFDKMTDYAIEEGSKGLGYIVFERSGEAKGPVAKFLTADRLKKIKELTNLKDGDAIFFSCNAEAEAAKIAGKVRTKIGRELGLINKEEYKFCWIVDFPLFEISEETGKLDFCHNPFSMPKGGMEAFNADNPLDIVCNQYDWVCNGYEMCSGAIRNHKLEILYKSFEMVGYPKDAVDKKFSAMVNAFKYGAPPHGGIAPGIDRIVMLLSDEPNLREIVAFPPNGKGQDLLMGAPSEVEPEQLKELHIKVDNGKK
ncbi:MAG: aspartate--tRNA ligase [Rickettsiales bacterium]|jgi:aspartyl-tRNA synthetase|nr:aspartate--tRNA ligase [Rickettsiales bacterium]